MSDAGVSIVDEAIRRIVADPASGWARGGRVTRENLDAWVVLVDRRWRIYWRFLDESTVLFVLLLPV
ncbi:MAG: hypothetical protein GEU79_04970 [Acidimicrobiia bacterium]|nr:hypothetical protein [Acidimicrobiia bacterium]